MPVQFRDELADVLRALDEGTTDHIGMVGHEGDIADILFRKQRKIEIEARKVHAFLQFQLLALVACDGHFEQDAALDGFNDLRADLAVVDPDQRARLDARNDVRKTDRDCGQVVVRCGGCGQQVKTVATEDALAPGHVDCLDPAFGARNIHDHRAGPSGLMRGFANVGDHPPPFARAVMGAIDAKAARAGLDQLGDKAGVVGSLFGHRHHDAGVVSAGVVTEKQVLVAGDVVQSGGQFLRRGPLRGPSRQTVERGGDGGERLARMGFGAAERREPKGGQIRLKLDEVALPGGEIESEVFRSRAKRLAPDFRLPVGEDRRAVGLDLLLTLIEHGAACLDARQLR